MVALLVSAGERVRSAVKALAAKLRLNVLLHGMKYMELFISEHEEFFGAWYNYKSEVRERLAAAGWHVVPDAENNWLIGSSDCSRLMYLAQLRYIFSDGVWLQQLVFPILVPVVQTSLRVFLPCELMSE